MNYLMVNNPDWPDFDARIQTLQGEGYTFSPAYIVKITDEDGTVYPGGYGCLKFADTVPTEVLFPAPDVEFRYSDDTQEWVPNGETTLSQTLLVGLYNYFRELLGDNQ